LGHLRAADLHQAGRQRSGVKAAERVCWQATGEVVMEFFRDTEIFGYWLFLVYLAGAMLWD
jgi:hypothetical protein